MQNNINWQEIKDSQITLKVKSGKPMPENQLKGYRGWAKKILRMTNDEIMVEGRKIFTRTSGLSAGEREFCQQMCIYITDYNMKEKRDGAVIKSKDSGSGKQEVPGLSDDEGKV